MRKDKETCIGIRTQDTDAGKPTRLTQPRTRIATIEQVKRDTQQILFCIDNASFIYSLKISTLISILINTQRFLSRIRFSFGAQFIDHALI